MRWNYIFGSDEKEELSKQEVIDVSLRVKDIDTPDSVKEVLQVSVDEKFKRMDEDDLEFEVTLEEAKIAQPINPVGSQREETESVVYFDSHDNPKKKGYIKFSPGTTYEGLELTSETKCLCGYTEYKVHRDDWKKISMVILDRHCGIDCKHSSAECSTVCGWRDNEVGERYFDGNKVVLYD